MNQHFSPSVFPLLPSTDYQLLTANSPVNRGSLIKRYRTANVKYFKTKNIIKEQEHHLLNTKNWGGFLNKERPLFQSINLPTPLPSIKLGRGKPCYSGKLVRKAERQISNESISITFIFLTIKYTKNSFLTNIQGGDKCLS